MSSSGSTALPLQQATAGKAAALPRAAPDRKQKTLPRQCPAGSQRKCGHPPQLQQSPTAQQCSPVEAGRRAKVRDQREVEALVDVRQRQVAAAMSTCEG